MLSEIGQPYDWPVGLFFFCLLYVSSIQFNWTKSSNLKTHMSQTIPCSYWINISVFSHVAALPTLKAKWLDTITVKRWEILINNDVSLSSATNEETPYEQLHYLIIQWNIDVYISVISVSNDVIYVCINIKPHVHLKMSHIFSIIHFVELLFEKFPAL